MAEQEKSLEEAVRYRRSTPSFDGAPMDAGDLQKIVTEGLLAPSG